VFQNILDNIWWPFLYNILSSSNLMANHITHITQRKEIVLYQILCMHRPIFFLAKILYLRFTVSLHIVFAVPIEIVASQTYWPSSSGNTSFIVSVANPFLYFRSKMSEELYKQAYLNVCITTAPCCNSGNRDYIRITL